MNKICTACLKPISEDDAYIAPTGKAYCSEDCFRFYKAMWKRIYKLVDDSAALRLEVKCWGKDFKKINYFLEDNSERIEEEMIRKCSNPLARVRYLSAIIKNDLQHYQSPKSEIVRDVGNEFYESKPYKPKKRRKCLADYFEE